MTGRLALAASLVSLASAALCSMALGCAGARPRTCSTTSACGAGEACVVGRCSAERGPSPIRADMKRLVVEAESIAFVSSGDDVGRVRPPFVALGADVGDDARILVKFPVSWTVDKLARAYLVLDRAEGAEAGPGEVLVRAEQVVEPWSLRGDARTSWANPPRSVSIGAELRVDPRGAAPIRLDVTPYATDLARKGKETWGLRVEAKGRGYGLPIATGFGASGAPPRLEVYLQP